MDERADSSEYSINHFNGAIFNMVQPDFILESDFANFISIIKEDPIEKFCLDFECNHFTNSCTELQLPPMSYGHNEYVAGDGDGAGAGVGTGSNDFCYDHVLDPYLDMTCNQKEEDVKVSEDFDDDDSSETVTNGNPDSRGRRRGGGAKGDRSRTLISERKRRIGMKEKLYALRSLVPNITKMDKASIVGDAARYIQDLQTQARNLRVEIATIEEATKNKKVSSQNSKKIRVSNSIAILKKISKFDMFEVEEKGYYVRLVCNKGRGVAVSLHKALESITSFKVQSSNLSTVGDNFVLTFNLSVTVCEFDINLPNLKLWLSGAFLNQGFEFNMFP